MAETQHTVVQLCTVQMHLVEVVEAEAARVLPCRLRALVMLSSHRKFAL